MFSKITKVTGPRCQQGSHVLIILIIFKDPLFLPGYVVTSGVLWWILKGGMVNKTKNFNRCKIRQGKCGH